MVGATGSRACRLEMWNAAHSRGGEPDFSPMYFLLAGRAGGLTDYTRNASLLI